MSSLKDTQAPFTKLGGHFLSGLNEGNVESMFGADGCACSVATLLPQHQIHLQCTAQR